ncbi:hypothetical protein M885DRAFT_521640 [Pelagophyceae sp. CCMP2097]|nr:hypothetical protein M885DRAFT_521640 [Pelagophyceae sp. CCMP2097]
MLLALLAALPAARALGAPSALAPARRPAGGAVRAAVGDAEAGAVETAPSRLTAALALARDCAGVDFAAGVDARDDGYGGVGLVAAAPLAAKARVISVARRDVLEVTDLDARRKPAGAPCTQDQWASKLVGWEGRLAVLLLQARAEAPPGSTAAAWLASLPAAYGELPASWAAADVSAMDYEPLARGVDAQRQRWRDVASVLLPSEAFTAADLDWALATILTRSFSGPFEGSTGDQRVATFGFAAVLATVYVALGLGPPEQAAQGLAAVAVSSILSDFLVSRDDSVSLVRHTLTPGVDLANHAGGAAQADASVAYEYFSDSFVISAHRDYAVGEAVCTSYGKKSNANLLLNYGFVEKGNPFDDYVFPADAPFAALRGATVTRAGFPTAVADAAVELAGGVDEARSSLAAACDAAAAKLAANANAAGGATAPQMLANQLRAEHRDLLLALAQVTRDSAR